MQSTAAGNSQELAPHLASYSSRRAALYVLCTGMLMIVLDATIVNVAAPVIKEDLGFTNGSITWVINAYLISFGGLLLLAGRLGDLVGRRSMFLAGLALFTLASMLCGLSNSEGMLVGARFLQGIGGAMTSAVILGMIVTMFPDPKEQASAIGVFAFVASAGGAVGLLIGGLLTSSISWHAIFYVNVPVGIITAVLALRLINRDQGLGFKDGADVLGALLVISSLMLGVYTIVKPAAELGWANKQTLVLGLISIVLMVAFVIWESRVKSPLVPLRIFKVRSVSSANVIQILSVAGMFGLFFLGSLYLSRVLGYDATEIGLAFLPVTIFMGTLSFKFAEPLATRFGPRKLVIAGLFPILAALLWFARVPIEGNYWVDVMPTMVLLGIGAGICFPALMNLAMSGTEPMDAGLASGLVNTSAQVGGALGLAILATLASGRTEKLSPGNLNDPAALTSGYHLAFWVAAALVAVGIVGGIALIPKGSTSGAHGHGSQELDPL